MEGSILEWKEISQNLKKWKTYTMQTFKALKKKLRQ